MYTNVPGAETRDTVQKSTAYTREEYKEAGGGFTHRTYLWFNNKTLNGWSTLFHSIFRLGKGSTFETLRL